MQLGLVARDASALERAHLSTSRSIVELGPCEVGVHEGPDRLHGPRLPARAFLPFSTGQSRVTTTRQKRLKTRIARERLVEDPVEARDVGSQTERPIAVHEAVHISQTGTNRDAGGIDGPMRTESVVLGVIWNSRPIAKKSGSGCSVVARGRPASEVDRRDLHGMEEMRPRLKEQVPTQTAVARIQPMRARVRTGLMVEV